MANNKQDIEIGHRAYEEFERIANESGISKMGLFRKSGMAKSTVENFKFGGVPSALSLARLHYVGADVMYILIGNS